MIERLKGWWFQKMTGLKLQLVRVVILDLRPADLVILEADRRWSPDAILELSQAWQTATAGTGLEGTRVLMIEEARVRTVLRGPVTRPTGRSWADWGLSPSPYRPASIVESQASQVGWSPEELGYDPECCGCMSSPPGIDHRPGCPYDPKNL